MKEQPPLRSSDVLGVMVLLVQLHKLLKPDLLRLSLFFKRHNATFKLTKSLFVCGSLYSLMLCNLAANPVTATSQEQSERGQSGSIQTATRGVTQNNATESSSHAAKSRDALKSLKAMLGNFRVQLTIWVLSGFSIGWHLCKWRMEKIVARMTPNY